MEKVPAAQPAAVLALTVFPPLTLEKAPLAVFLKPPLTLDKLSLARFWIPPVTDFALAETHGLDFRTPEKALGISS